MPPSTMGKPRTACRRDPERKEASRLDAQAAIAGKGLHGLVAAEGGAGQDAPDWVVLEADYQPGGSASLSVAAPAGRAGAARQIWAGPVGDWSPDRWDRWGL